MRRLFALLFTILLFASNAHAYVYKAYFSHGTTSSYINASSDVGVTFTVDTGTNSATFPTTNFPVILYGAGCNSPEYCPDTEIITISSRSGNAFTIGARAQGGTTVHAWTISSNIKEVLDISGTGGAWGSITGALSDQTDLSGALASKDSVLSFTSPLVRSVNTITCQTASGSQPGCLASGDWSIFNGKQDALGFTPEPTLGNPSVDAYCLKSTIAGIRSWGTCGSGGSSDFGSLASGTNTGAAMVVDTGASLNYSNTGTINASGYQGQSTTTGTELGYVHGLTSALQTQLNAKASTTHASTHASAGSDPITISESQVTGLTSDLSAKLNLALTTDYTWVGVTGVSTAKALPDCSNGTTDKLLYNISTHAFSCGVDQTAAGGSGITTLNTLVASTQGFATGTSGSDFNISSTSATHTFNIPDSSASHRGALTNTDWSTFNGKQASISTSATPNFYGWDKTWRQVTFDLLGSGTNVTAAMLCGTGCSLGYTGSGTVNANRYNGSASVPVANGGTGLTSLGTANQFIGMNSGATALEYKTLSVGTTGSDFNISNSAGALTINLPAASATVTGKLSSTDWSTFNGKLSTTGNGSGLTGMTATQVGLGNVTNDAQLKRAAADFNSFTVKTTPVSADVILIEDSAASYAKKKILYSSLPGAATTKYALVTLGSTQNIIDSSTTTINFSATVVDTSSFVGGSDRFVVPAGVTKVKVSTNSNWDTNTAGMRTVAIYKNGSAFSGMPYDRRMAVSTGSFPGVNAANLVSSILAVTPGDYFQVKVLQNSGSTIGYGIDSHVCWFSIEAVQ